jgi:hypothetical protein
MWILLGLSAALVVTLVVMLVRRERRLSEPDLSGTSLREFKHTNAAEKDRPPHPPEPGSVVM